MTPSEAAKELAQGGGSSPEQLDITEWGDGSVSVHGVEGTARLDLYVSGHGNGVSTGVRWIALEGTNPPTVRQDGEGFGVWRTLDDLREWRGKRNL